MRLADRITVLRDGRSVGTQSADQVDQRELVQLDGGPRNRGPFPPSPQHARRVPHWKCGTWSNRAASTM